MVPAIEAAALNSPALQTAGIRMHGSSPLLPAEAFQSRWKRASIKICATSDIFKNMSIGRHAQYHWQWILEIELFSKTKQSEIFIASIGIFLNTVWKTVFQLYPLLPPYFFMHVHVTSFHLREVYVRLALLAEFIYNIFEVACSQMKIFLCSILLF